MDVMTFNDRHFTFSVQLNEIPFKANMICDFEQLFIIYDIQSNFVHF